MTVTKKHTVTLSDGAGKNSKWQGNLGASWQYTGGNISFTAPSGFTLSKVESVVTYKNSGATATVSSYANSSLASTTLTLPKSTTYTTATLQWSVNWVPSGTVIPPSYGKSSGSGHFAIDSITWYYTKSSTVTAGNKIEDTDWTNVGLSATEGNKITKPSGVSGLGSAIISASEWNNATVTLTF